MDIQLEKKKGIQKKHMIYVVKLNPLGKEPKIEGPSWLLEFDDVFAKEITKLPPQ